MLSDHININLKRGVQIITCEPAERKIEAETRNGEVISINAYYYSPIFRWPVPGEKWVVREENGSWYLEGIYETQGTFDGEIRARPGDTVLSVASGRILINEEGQLRELSSTSFPRLIPTATAFCQMSGMLFPKLIP